MHLRNGTQVFRGSIIFADPTLLFRGSFTVLERQQVPDV